MSVRRAQDGQQMHEAETPGVKQDCRKNTLLGQASQTWYGAHRKSGNKGGCMAGQHDGLVVRLVHAADQLGQHLAAGDTSRRPKPSLCLHISPYTSGAAGPCMFLHIYWLRSTPSWSAPSMQHRDPPSLCLIM